MNTNKPNHGQKHSDAAKDKLLCWTSPLKHQICGVCADHHQFILISISKSLFPGSVSGRLTRPELISSFRYHPSGCPFIPSRSLDALKDSFPAALPLLHLSISTSLSPLFLSIAVSTRSPNSPGFYSIPPFPSLGSSPPSVSLGVCHQTKETQPLAHVLQKCYIHMYLCSQPRET